MLGSGLNYNLHILGAVPPPPSLPLPHMGVEKGAGLKLPAFCQTGCNFLIGTLSYAA